MDVVLQSEYPATVRTPDLIVVPYVEVANNYAAADVRLGVEIISPGSRVLDRWTKWAEYAQAGIPIYWVVDPDDRDGPTLTVFELLTNRDQYGDPVEHRGRVTVERPCLVDIELDALIGSAVEPSR